MWQHQSAKMALEGAARLIKATHLPRCCHGKIDVILLIIHERNYVLLPTQSILP